ncbi:MAG TPA: YdeI/OmpD-associated family protein [Candidatus Limnocylindrales bacterium]
MNPENVRFFGSAAELRAWLEANHESAQSQWIGFHKKASGRSGLTYDDAVIEALCFGWIDGQTNSVDEFSITTRFSPRRAGSNWSQVNTQRARELIASGRMHPAGRRVFETRREPAPGEWTYETRPADLPEPYASTLRSNEAAWRFWQAQRAAYRKSMTWWVLSAKREETRMRRLEALIEESAAGRAIDELHLPKLRAER